MADLIFPDSATSKERAFSWVEIGSVSDSDLGFVSDSEQPEKIKFGVRVLLFNEKGELGMVKSAKYGYTQIPGGGLDEGETIEASLRRETAEEMGYTIKDIRPLGYFREARKNSLNNHSWNIAISFVYTALTAENIGTNYMADEIEEGFMPIWLNLDKTILAKNKNLQDILASKASYSGTFSNCRDLKILEYYRDNFYAKD